ncbi:DUF1272 domain-containing protein [Arenibaculum sp.]|uniref:DUF1272 domain-containing protein n=1 Tax=Arenibaculum sp. TaxID=2865862 RepID=UPI002E12F578|nr:DUF1272 domain-containing protein [Arenibaculum sp.]
MLELRPNCQLCDRDLPPTAKDARICSYECTYCADCVDTVLHDVCPSCGGNFVPRPIRPVAEWRLGSGLGLRHDPASTERRHTTRSREDIESFAQRIRGIAPDER